MSRPSEYPDWATVEQTDPVSGQLNRVKPSTDKQEEGWTRQEIPPRQWFNWTMWITGRWVRYLTGTHLAWGEESTTGTEVLAAVDAEHAIQDTDWTTEYVARALFGGVYNVTIEHQTPDTSGDGLHEARVAVNGSVVETFTAAPADGVWYTRDADITLEDGDRVTIETRMSTGAPPREGLARNRRIRSDNARLHVIASAGERNTNDGVVY